MRETIPLRSGQPKVMTYWRSCTRGLSLVIRDVMNGRPVGSDARDSGRRVAVPGRWGTGLVRLCSSGPDGAPSGSAREPLLGEVGLGFEQPRHLVHDEALDLAADEGDAHGHFTTGELRTPVGARCEFDVGRDPTG